MPVATESEPEALRSGLASVGRRYVKAALHTGLGGVVSRALSGLAPIVLARYLGPKQYGVYVLVLSLVGIVAGVSHLGQNTALQKFLPEYFVRDRARGGAIMADTIILVTGTLAVVCTAFFLLSGRIASTIYHEPSLVHVFEFSALLVLFLSLFNLASSVVAGLLDFKSYSIAIVIRSAGYFVLAWAGVWLLGLYGALGGQLLAYAVSLVFLTWAGLKATRRRFPNMIKVAFSQSILREIFSFAFPAFLAGMLVGPAYWWANTVLARDSGFVQVGLFGVAFVLARLILVIPSSLSVPAVSFMSETYASTTEQGGFSSLVGANVRLVWAVTLPISLGCALFAPWIVTLLFGSAYRDAVPLISVMCLAALLMAINNVIGSAIAASGRMWQGFAINSFWLVIFLGSGLMLIPKWGSFGLAMSFALSYFAFTLFTWRYTAHFMGLTYDKVLLLSVLTVAAWGLSFGVSVVSDGTLLKFSAAIVLLLGLAATEWKWVLSASERSIVVGLVR